jgi:hypothetical protein
MIRLYRRMSKNLYQVPTSVFLIIFFMPILGMIVGARDVVLIWVIVEWGLLIYLAVKRPVEHS